MPARVGRQEQGRPQAEERERGEGDHREHVGLVADARSETRIVPAIAVPNVEPRLETLRDSPDISPCFCSGKLDCTMLTEGVSITPRPRPISNSPGTKAQTLSDAPTNASSRPMPVIVTTNPARMSVRWACRLATRSAARDETRAPPVAQVKMTRVLIALKSPTVWRKTDTTNEMPISNSRWTFCVASPRFQMRLRNNSVDRSGSLPARSRRRM